MKTLLTLSLAATLVAGAFMVPSAQVQAGGGSGGGLMYAVTITNLTPAQIFSPPLLASHDVHASLFTPGEPASPSLALLAEDGDNIPLRDDLLNDMLVTDVMAASAPIMPGDSATYMIGATPGSRQLSAAGMLISTNDTFFGVDGLRMPRSKKDVVRYLAPAYDAGSEANSEDCAYIPGPPCGAGAVHDPAPAEGFVHISNGIHGIGGVPAATYDWRNPVALITVKRL